MGSATPYKIFDTVLLRKKALSPHLMRVTLSLRKYLIKECGIAKQSLNLMGYWRYNKVGG